MRLMNPRPLKFSDVLHSTPTPVCSRDRRQEVVERRRCVSCVTVCARADPSTCVTAGSAPGLTRAEIEHVRVLEVLVEDLSRILEAAAGRDRAVALALLDLVQPVLASTRSKARPAASGCRAPAGRSPTAPAPTPPRGRRPAPRPGRARPAARRSQTRRIGLGVMHELQAAVDVPVDRARLAGQGAGGRRARCRAPSPSRPCRAARTPTRSAPSPST